MRQISVAPWVFTGGGVKLSLPRAGWWQGQGWREQEQSKSCKAGRRNGEVNASKKTEFEGKLENLREQSYCNQKWTSEWSEQLNLRRLSCQPVV